MGQLLTCFTGLCFVMIQMATQVIKRHTVCCIGLFPPPDQIKTSNFSPLPHCFCVAVKINTYQLKELLHCLQTNA